MPSISQFAGWLKYQVRRRTKRRLLPDYLDDLGPGDIVIDCGANVGKITVAFAKSGATIYAFEPDEVAFSELEKNVGHLDNVRCVKSAVSDADGSTKLYHRPDRSEDALLSTQGSSLEGDKENVDEGDFQIVATTDLAAFISKLPGRVACIKMDIEGHEATVLEHLLNSGVLDRIDTLLVETHERKVPGLGEQIESLKPKMAAFEHLRIDWNWI